MKRMKYLALGMVALAMLALPACDSGGDGGGTVAPAVGQLLIGGNGGTGNTGGNGVQLAIYPNQDFQILASGVAPIPAVTMPLTARVISANYTWTDADNNGPDLVPGSPGDDNAINGIDDCGEVGWAGSDDEIDGLYVWPGVTVTVPETLGCGGIISRVIGPVIIAGAIVADSANTSEDNTRITADEEIVVQGTIDMSGPDGDPGVQGGEIRLDSNTIQDNTDGVYINGNLLANGGDAVTTGFNGGNGGYIYVRSTDNANIQIAANMLVNGGNGIGTGTGGNAGSVVITNYLDTFAGPTHESLGRIILYNVNSIIGQGGDGVSQGGNGGLFYIESDNAGGAISVPMYFDAGDGTGVGSIGGNGNSSGDFMTAYDCEDGDAASVCEVTNSYLIITNNIYLRGGDGVLTGGYGGGFAILSDEGNTYIQGAIYLDGGDGTGAGGTGEFGGELSVYIIDDPATVEESWGVIQYTSATGGDGTDNGGDGGTFYVENYTGGYYYLTPGAILLEGGSGALSDGNIGDFQIYSDIILLGFFPTLASLP